MACILVIDDDPDFLTLMRDFLSERGHTVMEAQSANEGMDVFLREKIDLVLSDMMMPGKTGLDLLRELRSANPKALFIMITGYPGEDTARQALGEGAYDYLSKPLDMDQLTAVMRRALSTIELRSNLTAIRGINVALIIAIPVWILIGILVRFLLVR